MSWISEFAGKAENLLNRLDNNAASVLSHKNKRNSPNAKFAQPEDNLQAVASSPTVSGRASPISRSPELPVLRRPLSEQKANDELLTYMKIPDEVAAKNARAMPVHTENEMLRNEVRSVNVEISLLLARVKAAEAESSSFKILLGRKDGEIALLKKEISSPTRSAEKNFDNGFLENERLKLNYKSRNEQIRELEEKLADVQLEAHKRKEEFKAELGRMRVRVTEIEESLATSNSERAREVRDLTLRLEESMNELEDYKVRARKSLSDKETLIARLKSVGEMSPSTESMEVRQLREELETVVVALDKCEERVEVERRRAQETASKLEQIREEFSGELRTGRALLRQESERRLAAVESCRHSAEEVHNVRDELTRRLTATSDRLREKVEEVTNLKRQIAQRKMDNTIEGKVSALTTALVQKQTALEALANERNKYRLEMERLKNSSLQYANQSSSRGNVNDTDDAKAQVPAFMLESPFDTHVARKVKRAYSSLDAVSVWTGTFLRRYPLARVLVVSYGLCLHLWVCVVLFSNTPDSNRI